MASRLAPLFRGPLEKAPPKRQADRRIRDKYYLAFLHGLPCCVSGMSDGVIAHHLTIGRGRIGVKEDDSLALPLHPTLHDQHADALHVIGERNFFNKYGIDCFALARDLYALFETHGPFIAGGHEIIRMHRECGQIRVRQGIKLFDEKSVRQGDSQ